jgi:hypothetical protein
VTTRVVRALSATAGAALVLAVPTVAYADGARSTRVVVAGPEGDAIASRLQKELTAMGFEPVRVDDAAGCAGAAIIAWVEEMHASGAACSDGASASVWVNAKGRLRIADVVSPRPNEDHAPDLVAVRAAEVARASLELAGDSEAAAPSEAPARTPPTWTADPPTSAVDTAADATKKKKRVPATHTPVFLMGVGPGVLMGADVNAVGLDGELAVRLARYVGLSTRATVTFDGAKVATTHGAVNVAPSVFGLGPTFAMTPTDSFIIPRAGGGVGLVWLRSSAALATLDLTRGSAVPVGTTSVTSPMAYVNASASMRIAKAFRLTFEALVGSTAHRLVVRAQGEHVAYWGQPFGTFAMRGELMFR